MVRARRDARRLAAALAAFVVLTACGSTVPPSEYAAVSGTGPDGLGGGLGPSGPDGQPGTGPGQTGAGSGGPGGGPSVPGSPPLGSPGVAATAPGITDDAIYFGAGYAENPAAANAALGAGNLDQGDVREYYKVIIDMINRQGGLAGRELKPIYHGYDTLGDISRQDAEACERWTKDNKVFLIIAPAGGEIMNECAKDAGAIIFGSGGAGPDTFKRYPQLVDIDGMNLVRAGAATVDGLNRLGYFEPGAKIGVVTWDDQNYIQGLQEGIVPSLRRLGLEQAIEPALLSVPQSLEGLGATSADASSAVLRFNTAEITHVVILDGRAGACAGGCITVEWTQNAESQGYRPRYGANDGAAMDGLYEDDGLVPREQVEDAVQVVWLDLDKSDDAESPGDKWRVNVPRERCYEIMRDAGFDPDNANAQAAILGACGSLWFLQQVIGRVQGPLNAASFMEAVNGLGYSFWAPLSYYNFFSADRHDGTAGIRIIRCECRQEGDIFEYVGGAYRV